MGYSRGRSNRAWLVVVGIVLVLALIWVAVYFLLQSPGMRYLKIELYNTTNSLELSSDSQKLAPNSVIIKKPVVVSLNRESNSAYIRAKIVFESNSEDDRVLSFVNQLNYNVSSIETFENENYTWQYNEEDNSFYLMNNDTLKIVSKEDDNYYFFEQLTVPNTITQISSTNSDGENVQIGEDITIRIIFEALQSSEVLGNKVPNIDNARPYFNNLVTYTENGFTSQNGYLISYVGTASNLILPKYVGNDYIIGIKNDVFVGTALKQVIVPGSYIYFGENAFSGATALSYVALKSYTPIKLASNSFSASVNLDIYVPADNLSYVKETYSTVNFINNIKSYTEITTSEVANIDTSASVIYAPYVENFNGTFEGFSKLKLFIAPNLKTINENMFKNITTLIEVVTPNATLISKSAFYNCTGLINASFSKKLSSVGEQAFLSCKNLTNINFVQNSTVIEREAFRNCSGITSVKLLGANISIGSGAFYQCTNLKSVEINSVNLIDNHAFAYCSGLKYCKINELNGYVVNSLAFEESENAYFVFTKTEDKTNFISNTPTLSNKAMLLEVEDGVLTNFEGDIKTLNLAEISIVERIVKISDGTFKNNETITTLILPASVRNIEKDFINGCTKLTNLTINSSLPPEFADGAFNNVSENLNIYVPQASVELYKQVLSQYNLTILNI